MSRYIKENIKRKLYAESMGRCMNPNCKKELFSTNGDISEKAHIEVYFVSLDNSYENLILLCPNCHTEYDKNHAFTKEEMLNWKKIRKEELEKFFSKKFKTFEELEKEVVPLLLENKSIFENYYLKNHRKLWDKFEPKILANNKKLKMLFLANLNLFQRDASQYKSNLKYIQEFIAHVDEFEQTRFDTEKEREMLFPEEINSIFGVEPIVDSIISSTESLELLIKKLKEQGKFEKISLGTELPFIQLKDNGKSTKVFLIDTPRLIQFYYNYKCYKRTSVRLGSLNFALTYINYKKINYSFPNETNLREILINGKKMLFIYEYCLSQEQLMRLSPEKDSIIVNLHNWNGDGCISNEAYELAKHMQVKLLHMEDFYEYINSIKQ